MALKEQVSIRQVIQEVIASDFLPSLQLTENPLVNDNPDVRPNSASVEDHSFGDSGKARVAQELNQMMRSLHPSGNIYSFEFNGSRNSGHEVMVNNGARISFHQLPVAVIQEGAFAIMSRGKLVHPVDLLTEIAYAESKLGSVLPGTLIIDANAPVTTDLHSAYETFTNSSLDVGHGSTGSGVAQGYSTVYEKRAVTVGDLMSSEWKEIFTKQYAFYAGLVGGEANLQEIPIKNLNIQGGRTENRIGTISEFLEQLAETRDKLRKYVQDVRPLFEDIWRNTTIPVTFPGSQGGALDPYHGVYPDITASRPIGRIGIPDATEGVVVYEQIAMRTSVIKVPYMSSVGSRRHPYAMDEEIAQLYRNKNEERGRSTGRDRGIYPIDLVIMKVIHGVAGYTHQVVTHMDAAFPDIPLEAVTMYVNKETGQVEPYRPYQWHWDRVNGVVDRLTSWDGAKAEMARSEEELPVESTQFLHILSRLLGPIAFVTNGRSIDNTVSFLPNHSSPISFAN